MKKAKEEGLITLDDFYFEFSAFFVLQVLVAPHVFLNKIDYHEMYKNLAHELEHYKDYALGYYHKEFGFKEKISPLMALKGDYRISHLYACLCDLHNEGSADFRKRRNSPKFIIIPSIIKKYRKKLTRMLSLRTKEDIEEYYEKELYVNSIDGNYENGFWMMLTLAFAIDPKNIIFETEKGERKRIDDLDKLLSSEKMFYVYPLSPKTFEETLGKSSHIKSPEDFLEEYERACNRINISNKNRSLTMKIMKGLWRKAESAYEKEEIHLLKKNGFYPKL